MDTRLEHLKHWIEQETKTTDFTLTPIKGDASFRRYFRVQFTDKTLIAMDAPPEHEESYPFITVAKAFRKLGLQVPEIFCDNLSLGFLLITDLGDDLYLNTLNVENADDLYEKAINDLLTIQTCKEVPGWSLPHFDRRFIMQELDMFMYWFVDRYLQLPLTQKETARLQETFNLLIESAETQPQICTHRDYHSRNLLLQANGKVGIVDFQDAVWGPITYDLVSLLRDCYIDWPKEKVTKWALSYLHKARAKGIMPSSVTPEQFMQWFDFMGIQRHLKASFIFVRKLLRDDNPAYLDDVPRTLNYIQQISAQYPQLEKFNQLFNKVIMHKFNEVIRK